MGDNDQLISGGRLAVPAVRGVEQVTAHHRHPDGVPEGLDVSADACETDTTPCITALAIFAPQPNVGTIDYMDRSDEERLAVFALRVRATDVIGEDAIHDLPARIATDRFTTRPATLR